MKLTITKSKNSVCFYVQRSVRKDGKITTVTVEKLGNLDQVKARAAGKDPYVWAKEYVEELNRKEYEERRQVIVSYSPGKLLKTGEQQAFNCGYLFLQDIYYDLKLDKICSKIASRHSFDYDLNSILSRLIYTRILYPSSKLSSLKLSEKFIEQPSFELQHIYRALSVLTEENDFIQAELYKNSQKVIRRSTDVLYYDCTNYYFEIEMEDEYRKYGHAKDHKPNPVVGMGLFMDHDGIPLAFTTFPGSNEKPTLLPLERKVISDFGVGNIVVCTDAGLATDSIRKFNDIQLGGEAVRSFITVQSLKDRQIKSDLQAWALDPHGWQLPGSDKEYCLDDLDDELDKDKIFYKERWTRENISGRAERIGVKPLEQRLIVSYSIKYRDYLRSIRDGQIRRAKKMISRGDTRSGNHTNDPRRLIDVQSVTVDGEVCEYEKASLDLDKVTAEERFDGFYAVCTNLEDAPISEIIRINKKRWEIEECFRIMKTDFQARPVYLQRDDRINAHFLTCFIALYIYRILEKKIGEKYTCSQILGTLKDMLVTKAPDNIGYIPSYTRTEITDALHETFGFRTDYEIISSRSMRSILSRTKK